MGSKSKKNVKILVVDNNRQLTDAIVEMLSRSGYPVTGAYGGMEGVKRFQDGDFQVVVTDLKMPDVDGMDLLKTVIRDRQQGFGGHDYRIRYGQEGG